MNNPDWDKLEACQESLREHMALLKEAADRIEAIKRDIAVCLLSWDKTPIDKSQDGRLQDDMEYLRRHVDGKRGEP